MEDDLSLIGGLTYAMKKEGYEVENARTAAEAEVLWAEGKYDLVILDVALPDSTGFALCEKMRQISKVPIMFLTAADEETDMIMGLDIGADDYITKPFKLAVFLSRIHALLRRSENFMQAGEEISMNGITLDMRSGEARKEGKTLELTSGEYKCFGCLWKIRTECLRRSRFLPGCGTVMRILSRIKRWRCISAGCV